MHCLRKGGLGGTPLTWDCCRAKSTMPGCTARPSGVVNRNYELTCPPTEIGTVKRIADWRLSIMLLRQRFQAHVAYLDRTGPPFAPVSEDEVRRQEMWIFSLRGLFALTPAQLYKDAGEDARVLLHLFEHKLVPDMVSRSRQAVGSSSWPCWHAVTGSTGRHPKGPSQA